MRQKAPALPPSSERLIPLVLLVLIAGLGAAYITRRPDRAYIAYRYAENLAAGLGFAFNPGEPYLAPGVSPLYVVLLALLRAAFADLPLIGALLGIAGMALAAGALLLMDERQVGAAAVLLSMPLLWLTLGLTVPLWVGACLLAIALYAREREAWAAVTLAAATLLQPEALVLAGVLVAAATLGGRSFRVLPVSLYAGVVLIALIWLLSTFADPFAFARIIPTDPDTIAGNGLEGLLVLGASWADLSLLWVVLIPLAVLGGLRATEHAVLIAAWGGLHIVVLVLLAVPVYPWSYAPLLVALAVLAALGVGWIAERLPSSRWIAVGGAILLIGGAGAESLLTVLSTDVEAEAAWQALTPMPSRVADAEIGRWLTQGTPPGARVGVGEGFGIGTVGYYSDRPLVDFHGALQPALVDAYQRRDGSWWLASETPDIVLLGTEPDLFDYVPTSDSWFTQAYTPIAQEAGAQIYQRVSDPLQLEEAVVGTTRYPGSLVITGLATDFDLSPLESGRLGRVRLSWLLREPQPDPLTVTVRIEGRDGTLAGINSRTVDFSAWPVNKPATTFHSLDLVPGLQPGVYDVFVGVGPTPTAVQLEQLALAKVPFPEAEFLGAVSGLRADFGEITLSGYRLARTTEALEVLLIWRANDIVRTDYRVVIQVRDLNGAVVRTVEQQPQQGIYPTSVWDAGEQVPDTYLVDLDGVVPGSYEVYAGLVGPGGERLLTVEGEGAVFVGRVTVGQ